MRDISRAIFFVIVISFITACTNAPAIQEESATARMLSPDEIKASFGEEFAINPYLEPYGMIRGKTTEFLVLKIDTSINRPAHITLDARIRANGSTLVASPQSLEEMKQFWSMWTASDADASRRLTSLERSYAPDFSFTAKAGKRSYYLVLMGKYPLPRPATVEAYLTVEGMEPLVFEAALPELPTKK